MLTRSTLRDSRYDGVGGWEEGAGSETSAFSLLHLFSAI